MCMYQYTYHIIRSLFTTQISSQNAWTLICNYAHINTWLHRLPQIYNQKCVFRPSLVGLCWVQTGMKLERKKWNANLQMEWSTKSIVSNIGKLVIHHVYIIPTSCCHFILLVVFQEVSLSPGGTEWKRLWQINIFETLVFYKLCSVLIHIYHISGDYVVTMVRTFCVTKLNWIVSIFREENYWSHNAVIFQH